MLPILLALTASAQTTPDLNGQMFRPSVDSRLLFYTEDTELRGNGATNADLLFQYDLDPVVYTPRDGAEPTEFVSSLLQANLLIGHTRGPLRLGLDVPVYLRSMGDISGGETGLGDITPDFKLTVVDGAANDIGLAFASRVSLPTATVEAPLGSRKVTGELEGVVDGRIGDVLLAFNAGYRFEPKAQIGELKWDDHLFGSLGLGWSVTESTSLSAEILGNTGLHELGYREANPVEAMIGAQHRMSSGLRLRGGVARGFGNAVGSPALRVLLGIGWDGGGAAKVIADADGDGIIDRKDACVNVPEDIDGIEDTDGCPDPTRVLVNVVDQAGNSIGNAKVSLGDQRGKGGTELDVQGGDQPLKVEADTFKPIDRVESIPNGANHELTVKMEPAIIYGKLMVKAVDTDGKPIADARWRAKGETNGKGPAGTQAELPIGAYTLTAMATGYRSASKEITVTKDSVAEIVLTMEPAKVEVTAERIDLKDSVYFELGSDKIKAESFDLLNEVAEVMINHPELTRIRVEGHTDSRGSASSNLALSTRRAASVVAYLVGKGVDAGRLESEGFGESKPLDPANNEAAYSKNRRVDFFVVGRSD